MENGILPKISPIQDSMLNQTYSSKGIKYIK